MTRESAASWQNQRIHFRPMSSGWLCEHLYTQYEYTLDENFQEETAYPLMKEAALFYLALLKEEEGYLAFGPFHIPGEFLSLEWRECGGEQDQCHDHDGNPGAF